jgi:hypothetical protein
MRLPEDSRCIAVSMLPRFAAKARSDWMEAMFVLMVRAMKISVESSSVQIPSTGDMQIACHRIATPAVHCQIGIKQAPGQRGPTEVSGSAVRTQRPCDAQPEFPVFRGFSGTASVIDPGRSLQPSL